MKFHQNSTVIPDVNLWNSVGISPEYYFKIPTFFRGLLNCPILFYCCCCLYFYFTLFPVLTALFNRVVIYLLFYGSVSKDTVFVSSMIISFSSTASSAMINSGSSPEDSNTSSIVTSLFSSSDGSNKSSIMALVGILKSKYGSFSFIFLSISLQKSTISGLSPS